MSEVLLEEKFIETSQGRIFYYRDLSFSGQPTVVMLHGLSSNHTTWDNIAAKLHAAGYNSLAVDLRGHGHSDQAKKYSNYRWSRFSEDLKQILEQENLQKIILVGYSYGGNIALDFAGRFADKLSGLVLISTNFVQAMKYRHIPVLRWVLWLVLNFLSVLFLVQHRKSYRYFQHGQSTGFWHSFWIGLNTMPFSINVWMFSLCGFMNFKSVLPLITAPTVIIRASSDPYVTLREATDMKNMIRNSRLIVSNNPDHFLASHAQDEIASIIIELLKNL